MLNFPAIYRCCPSGSLVSEKKKKKSDGIICTALNGSEVDAEHDLFCGNRKLRSQQLSSARSNYTISKENGKIKMRREDFPPYDFPENSSDYCVSILSQNRIYSIE